LKVPVYDEEGIVAGETAGLFARTVKERFPLIAIVEEEELEGIDARERWIRRIHSNPLGRETTGE
jgi:hypothetical protein